MSWTLTAKIASIFAGALLGASAAPAAELGRALEPEQIERRKGLTYKQFAREYMFANKPVILVDAIESWAALSRWTPELFKSEFGDMTFVLDEELKRKAAYTAIPDAARYRMSDYIDQVLASTEAAPAPYFRNRVLYDEFPTLVPDIQPLPSYFQPNWLPDRYLLGSVGEVLNRGAAIELYIGGKGGSFPVLHYDGAASHAFLMQIYGRKKFILYSPSQERFLYPSPEKPNLSMVNSIDAPDLDKFPLFAHAVPITFVLEPGEMAFIPSRWWHTTKMLTPSISVSINTVNQSNWQALIDYVAMRQNNPLVSVASRAYLTGAGAWRAWRDRGWSNRNQATTL
jgi:histone arginine demethylase JMJD6